MLSYISFLFGLMSLLNGILTLVGYFNANAILLEVVLYMNSLMLPAVLYMNSLMLPDMGFNL